MNTLTRRGPSHGKATVSGLVAVMLMASVSVVAAQQPYPSAPNPYYGGAPRHEYRSVAPSRWDRFRFDHAGTRGRLGLGASPLRPEGPGNVSD